MRNIKNINENWVFVKENEKARLIFRTHGMVSTVKTAETIITEASAPI